MRRTFVAIKTKLNDGGLDILSEIKDELYDEKIKWLNESNFHLTLFFMGDTSEDLIKMLKLELQEAMSTFKAFNLVCKGFGVFRNVKTPRALWFGFKKSNELLTLKNIIDEVMTKVGLDLDKKDFSPHLTIGRTKFIANRQSLGSLLKKYKNYKIQEFRITEVIFYESVLTPQGAIYKEIKKFDLDISTF